MAAYRVGIIGCGRPHRAPGATGSGQAHRHALGYKASPDAQIVALADIVLENAQAFQAEHGGERVYQDYREMLAKEALDIVSICTWPHLHAPMVIAAAEAGVKAILCEKPMALTFGDAKRMVEVCERAGAQLSFSHQRRFGVPFRKAKELLKSGAIGQLTRLEAMCSNLYDWGTHWFDMMFFYNDETPAEWVIGQIDLRGTRTVFGAPCEGQGLSHFKFRNGVRGLMVTGYEAEIGAQNRLVGTEGTIEVGVTGGPPLRVRGRGQGDWEVIPADEGLHALEAFQRAVLDVIDALKHQREPELSGRRALQATELIFATYESSRRRARVDLPLDIEDSPLQALLNEAS
ncbi:MAG: Gfo/Idh/MocA family oxidoreductase [Armatimonadota bacterium]|nr:Gfo/Idh/MocA family oxidoreductase [Armatimonadota bacterium]